MTDELRAKLESLRSIAPRLNQTTDQAAATLKATDAFLESLGIGIEAYAPWYRHTEHKDDDSGERRSTNSHLAYGRINGKFSIHVACITNRLEPCPHGSAYDDQVPIREEITPWPSCPREDKLKSFATLPALLGGILENAKELVDRADEAAKVVGEMMGSLADAKPTPIPKSGPVARNGKRRDAKVDDARERG